MISIEKRGIKKENSLLNILLFIKPDSIVIQGINVIPYPPIDSRFQHLKIFLISKGRTKVHNEILLKIMEK